MPATPSLIPRRSSRSGRPLRGPIGAWSSARTPETTSTASACSSSRAPCSGSAGRLRTSADLAVAGEFLADAGHLGLVKDDRIEAGGEQRKILARQVLDL